MKYIFLIICSIILPIFSLKEVKPKLCINCKYFITDNRENIFGKCSLFPLVEDNLYFLVNGIDECKMDNYYYCSTSRTFDKMCGKEGKFYKRKYNKKESK